MALDRSVMNIPLADFGKRADDGSELCLGLITMVFYSGAYNYGVLYLGLILPGTHFRCFNYERRM